VCHTGRREQGAREGAPEVAGKAGSSGPRASEAAGKAGSTSIEGSRAWDREHRRRTGPRAPEAAKHGEEATVVHGEEPRERPRSGSKSRRTERTQERLARER
jgi:hypothetical protein